LRITKGFDKTRQNIHQRESCKKAKCQPSNKMFSSLSSYIWGGEEGTGPGEESPPAPVRGAAVLREASPDDWVLVGETSNPAPGNLGGALPPLPGDSTPSQSSSNSSEAGDVESVESAGPVAGRQRAHHQGTVAQQAVKKELESVRSGQLIKQKHSGKALTSKALKRKNKTVYSQGNKKQIWRQNPSLKMAGANKNLKQC